ncbi:olfactory receptor 52Z1P-like [Hyperolius riggenbachi]|uniref:olfactory receptor 52Z1P-like n=1 Tax=Hyperolius riggenbachi TaxID=752182 RepID=UPI0035A27D49
MTNTTIFHPKYFLLMGIPGLEHSHFLISIPFCIMYILALVGNATLLVIISASESLHQPMYIFLAMLTGTDLLLSTSAIPKALSIFWLNCREILFDSCLIQIFSIHFLFVVESSILLTMALDRFVAICYPLTYSVIITNLFIKKMILVTIIRALCIITPLIFLLNRLPYQNSIEIPHTYCEHMGVARMATADVSVNYMYGLLAALCSTGVDMILIFVSYVMIFWTVIKLRSTKARSKAFNTCGTHVCVILLFYIPAFFSFIAHRVAEGKIPPQAHILLANLYVLVPPMMNPIIYGVRTKEIHKCKEKVIDSQHGQKHEHWLVESVILNNDIIDKSIPSDRGEGRDLVMTRSGSERKETSVPLSELWGDGVQLPPSISALLTGFYELLTAGCR